MSIQSEINRISGNVSDALDAIEAKGVTIPTGANSDDLADLIGQISGGGGTGGITQDQDGYLVLSPDGGGGGGGGLEYEEGIWTPSADIADTTISFANSHTTPPILVMITESSAQSIGVADSNALLVIGNPYTYLGHPIVNGTASRYGVAAYSYTSTVLASSISNMTTESVFGTYLSTTSFRAYTGGTSRYWRAGRTYKWIAVWPPTT